MKDLMLRTPLYLLPVPKDRGCIRFQCDFDLTRDDETHAVSARQKEIGENPDEDPLLEKPYVWNGESMLTATVADLLDVWVITKAQAQYLNAYQFG
jgi:hypothetical protein